MENQKVVKEPGFYYSTSGLVFAVYPGGMVELLVLINADWRWVPANWPVALTRTSKRHSYLGPL